MNQATQHIPNTDILGNEINIGDRAILFSPRGVHYQGIIKQIGDKRWFEVDEGFRIGGIGNMFIIKSK
ncbi:hypothetical protein [Alkalihalobacillus trypoxylicola]|uniref:Uncharacterized protein n=1 Tax=Alkalihalobacillus trypoxylicola TaxID=519424 RepID=A0A162E735_9BACI|nr:hypothetical protein [Alkalihalobacillus trypoxylicola]KYG31931.1 hypothetical protein AZF04_03915 [Alkalihalobacillus trypoxylicola]